MEKKESLKPKAEEADFKPKAGGGGGGVHGTGAHGAGSAATAWPSAPAGASETASAAVRIIACIGRNILSSPFRVQAATLGPGPF